MIQCRYCSKVAQKYQYHRHFKTEVGYCKAHFDEHSLDSIWLVTVTYDELQLLKIKDRL